MWFAKSFGLLLACGPIDLPPSGISPSVPGNESPPVKDVLQTSSPTQKPTLVTKTVAPNLLVMRETFDTPRDEEWNAFLRLLEACEDIERVRLLVVTDGGGPNSAQRSRLEGVLKGRSMRVAIVTDSAKSRFIASAISLFNRDHRGFSRAEMAGAYAHLRLTAVESRQVEFALRDMEPMIK